MAASATVDPDGKNEGATTKAAKNGAAAGGSVGGGTGAALAAIIVFTLGALGVDASPIEWAINVVLSAALGGLLAQRMARAAGRDTPTDQVRTVTEVVRVEEGGPDEKAAAAERVQAEQAASAERDREREQDGSAVTVVPTTVVVEDDRG